MKHRLLCYLQALEQTLNTASTNADISRSFEEYFEIFDRFYADDIMASSDQREEPVRGNASVRALVFKPASHKPDVFRRENRGGLRRFQIGERSASSPHTPPRP